MKKFVIFFICIAAIIIIYLFAFPVPVKINRTVDAVEISLDDKLYCKPVKVTITGTYRWRLFGDDTFTGDIKFDIYELTLTNPLTQTDNIPSLTLQNGGDSLEYGEWAESEIFGWISCTPFMNKFIVQIYEKTGDGTYSWSTADGHCIVRAASREEALKVLKGFSNDHLPPFEYWVD